ncbi:MAG: amidase family protein [Acidobacteriota bacterium]
MDPAAVTAICALPANQLANRIVRRELSAVEALDAHLARIEQRNPELKAVVSLDVASARRQATDADRALAHGAVHGPLHGVPLTLKDGHEVASLRTTLGSEHFDRMADQDGAVAARLRAAGAIIIGHTNVAPMLGDYQSANPIFGRTANPWHPGRTAGGSSGGAAAAVAAGMTPLEIVSDLGGSIRLPAHFCGVYGLKPTEHRVPMTGFFRLPPGTPRTVRILSCLGPLARDLDDLALALSIVAGPDGVDSEVPPVPLVDRPAVRIGDLRIAQASTVPGVVVAGALREQVGRVASVAAAAGAEVEDRLPACDWQEANALFGDLVSAITSDRSGGRDLAWYFAALDRRDHLAAMWDAFFADFDVLLMPPAMTTAFPHCEPGAPLLVDGRPAPYFGQAGVLAMANLAGLPALVAPAGLDSEGLPVGVQMVGPRWSEMRLLAVCRALEEVQALPGFRPPPNPL